MTEHEERELILQAQRGHVLAFEQLVQTYDRQVLSLALSLMQNEEDAKDIYQEVFIRVYRALPKFRMESKFSTWLHRIVTNVCLTHRSRRRRYEHASLDQENEGSRPLSETLADRSSTDSNTLNTEIKEQVQQAMHALSPQQKLVFTLRHFEGFKLREIAVRMNCAEGTVKKYLFTATERLREQLKEVFNMNHNEYRELLPLLIYGELAKDEQTELKRHLQECAHCSEELEQLEKLQTTFDAAPLPKTSEHLLNEARMELRAALRVERSRKTWKDIWTERLQGWQPIFRISFAAAASLTFGIFIGYKAIRPSQQAQPLPTAIVTETRTAEPLGEMQITNVKFEDADASDGNVAFSFEAVRPMKFKGSINDPKAQKVLTYALVNAQNPGIRLHAVNALNNAKQLPKADTVIKDALIHALKDDENPGVRMEALTALQKFQMDNDIKEAILKVLGSDRSAGLRIAAIKSIEAERLMDQEVVKVLKEVQTDEEEYVRLSARSLLQEVSQKQ